MRPIDPLMAEHRLIERMVAIMRREGIHVREASLINTALLSDMVDFFRAYTDRTHHGKEEGILFRELAGKHLSPADKAMMDQLIEGHRWARRTVAELNEAGQSYQRGRYAALEEVVARLEALVGFYPMHIEREDRHFFPASMEYLSQPEQDRMLSTFWDWDRMMIHEKYRSVVDQLEATFEAIPGEARR